MLEEKLSILMISRLPITSEYDLKAFVNTMFIHYQSKYFVTFLGLVHTGKSLGNYPVHSCTDKL